MKEEYITNTEKIIINLAHRYELMKDYNSDNTVLQLFEVEHLKKVLMNVIEVRDKLANPIRKAKIEFDSGEFLKARELINVLYIAWNLQNEMLKLSYYIKEIEKNGTDSEDN